MENIILEVKQIEGAEPFFVPSKLSLSLEPSLSTKLTTVRFSLQDDRLPADYLTNGTVFREIKGTVEVSNDVAGSIYNVDGSINYDVLDAILIGFQVRGWTKDEIAEREKILAEAEKVRLEAELENQGGGITINP
jgi:hypothetical protein